MTHTEQILKEFDDNFEPYEHWQGDKWVTDKVKSFLTSALEKQKELHEQIFQDALMQQKAEVVRICEEIQREWILKPDYTEDITLELFNKLTHASCDYIVNKLKDL